MPTSNTPFSGSEILTPISEPEIRRRAFVWNPGSDTLVALGTLLGFWWCYWAGITINEWFLLIGIVVVGTLISAVTVLRLRGEGLEGLGMRRQFLIWSLVISAVLGPALRISCSMWLRSRACTSHRTSWLT